MTKQKIRKQYTQEFKEEALKLATKLGVARASESWMFRNRSSMRGAQHWIKAAA